LGRRRRGHRRSSGQSLVEFALVLPILLILLVGIGDLGRVFAAGIVIEGSARDGAEIGARSYLKENPTGPPTTAGTYYQGLHQRVAKAVCYDMKGLPDVAFVAATGVDAPGTCPSLPVAVCVHDGMDDSCGVQPYGATPPSGCTSFNSAPTNATPPPTGETSLYVEVRVCYQFNSITQSAFFGFPTIYLQDSRTFTVANY
jgi:Flp pilus assembly protein TadG